MISDPIADMLARIKNAYLSRHQTVEIPYSKLKEEIGKILVKEGYLKKLTLSRLEPVKPSGRTRIRRIIARLKYQKGQPVMEDFKRVSKPSRRIYARWDKIPRTLSGYGITLVSTPKGVMIDKEARKKKLGGEVICQVW